MTREERKILATKYLLPELDAILEHLADGRAVTLSLQLDDGEIDVTPQKN